MLNKSLPDVYRVKQQDQTNDRKHLMLNNLSHQLLLMRNNEFYVWPTGDFHILERVSLQYLIHKIRGRLLNEKQKNETPQDMTSGRFVQCFHPSPLQKGERVIFRIDNKVMRCTFYSETIFDPGFCFLKYVDSQDSLNMGISHIKSSCVLKEEAFNFQYVHPKPKVQSQI